MENEVNSVTENQSGATIIVTNEDGSTFTYTPTVEIDPATGEPSAITRESIESILQELQAINENTLPVAADPVSNPSGISMTYEQGQAILESLHTVETLGISFVAVVLVIFVWKWLYNLIGGTFFGGL